uniref:hypothetical protein n=1 Tax=Candidatus Electronema sp. TaxID=2698783 RepID=UPI0040568C65
MKAKKVVTGAVAALSLLALSATGVLAAGEVYCSSGTVVATGAGHAYVDTNPVKLATNLRSVTLTCAEGTAVNADWDGTARTFVIPATPDKDAILAAALTALAIDGSTVEFYLSNSKAPKPGTPQGLIRLLHVK